MDQKRIDAGSACRAKRVAQNRVRLVEIDVAHHFEIAVEVAVADRGDDDVADLAMIYAGDLLRGLGRHVANLDTMEEGGAPSNVDGSQKLIDAIGDQIRCLHGHIMSGADLDITC